MVNTITIGQYVPAESIIHRLDPRTKIGVVTLLLVALFVVNSFAGYGLIAGFLGAAILLSGLPARFVLKSIRPLVVIIIFTFVLNLFMTPGKAILSLGPLQVTDTGLYRATFMSVRLILLILATSLLTLTTSPIRLTDGVERLLAPFKRVGVPAHELAMMMTIALRFIPTLLEETDRIMKAQMARGADFESGNLVGRAKNLVPLLVPLFISAFRRADELATAMEARCYRGDEGRTKLTQLVVQRADWVALLMTVAFLSGTVIWFRV